MTPQDTRLLVVADDPLARAGLAMLLASQPGAHVVAQVSGAGELASAVEASAPDVALWDLGATARASAERLGEVEALTLPVVALTSDDALASDALAAGVKGLLPRDADALTLLTAARAAARGLVVLDPALAASLLPTRDRAAPRSREPLSEELTSREAEVLQELSAGAPNKTIAHRLGISEHTVKFHVNAILQKLGAESRTEAVVRAARLGLVIL